MRKTVLTILFAALLPLGLMAQITEPGATEPNQLYTTTYDNPGGPNHAPGGPNRNPISQGEIGEQDTEHSPVGAPWALLAFAATYGAVRIFRKKENLKD